MNWKSYSFRAPVCVVVSVLGFALGLGCGGNNGDLPGDTAAAGQAPTIQLSANPSRVAPGQTSVLTWSSAGAASVVIDNGIGSVGASGSRTVSPPATTTYVATATGTVGSATVSTTVSVGPLQFGRVFLVVLENQSYATVVGSSAMPYLNKLIGQYALATNYFANTHPSLGNYFMMTTGQIIVNNNAFSGIVTDDNLIRELLNAGKSWKVYAENLPAVGYLGTDGYPYAKHHNPFSYFSDVVNSPAQANNLVPYSQFSGDLTAGSLAQFVYILPNEQHDAHDCPPGMATCTNNDKLAVADDWLRLNIDPILTSAAFQADGLLILTFDESFFTDTENGGGHVATLIISSKAKPGFKSTTFYQHQNVLKLMLQSLGVSSFPGAAASSPDMPEFFQ